MTHDKVIEILKKYKTLEIIADSCNHKEIDIDFDEMAEAVDKAVALLYVLPAREDQMKEARVAEATALRERNMVGEALLNLVRAIPFDPSIHDESQYLAIKHATEVLNQFVSESKEDRNRRVMQELAERNKAQN